MSPSDDDVTSETLLSRLRQKHQDNEAWQEFDRRYRPRMLRQCRKLGLHGAAADEVVQEVEIKLLEKIGEFKRDREGALRAFLGTHVTFAVKRLWRRQNEAKEQPMSGLDEVAEPTAAGEATVTYAGFLDELVREFGESLVEAMLMRYVADMPAKEVGDALGMTEGAVNTAVSRFKKRLKERFGESEGRP